MFGFITALLGIGGSIVGKLLGAAVLGSPIVSILGSVAQGIVNIISSLVTLLLDLAKTYQGRLVLLGVALMFLGCYAYYKVDHHGYTRGVLSVTTERDNCFKSLQALRRQKSPLGELFN